MTGKQAEPERLSEDQLRELGDEIYGPAWRGLPASILGIPEQQEVLSHRWSLAEAVAIGDVELVRTRAQAFASFLEAKTREYQENHERRSAAARQLATSGIMVVKPGQPLAGPWPGVKPDLGGSHEA
jgi:hypothetical protein